MEVAVSTFEEVEEAVRRHEMENHVSFIRQTSTKDFGQEDWNSRTRNKYVMWKEGVGYTPHIVIGRLHMECRSGKLRQEPVENEADHDYRKHSKKVLVGRKLDCPAKVVCKDVINFPTFRVFLRPGLLPLLKDIEEPRGVYQLFLFQLDGMSSGGLVAAILQIDERFKKDAIYLKDLCDPAQPGWFLVL